MNPRTIRTFVSSLKRLQKALSLNNTLFAEFVGVGRTTLADWISGKNKPGRETIEKVLNRTTVKREAFQKHTDAMLDFIAVNTPGECD